LVDECRLRSNVINTEQLLSSELKLPDVQIIDHKGGAVEVYKYNRGVSYL